jgi:hypothetical protein
MKYWFIFCKTDLLLEKKKDGTYTIPCSEESPIPTKPWTHILNITPMEDGTEVKTFTIPEPVTGNPKYEMCGICNLQLEVEDEIVEGRTAEELVAAVDGRLEVTNLLVHIFLYFRNLRFESLHEILVDRTICHIYNLACHFFVSYHQLLLSVHLFLVECEGYFSISHANGVVGRIQANHLLSVCVGYGFVVARMVVTEENQVEARHFFCHLDRGVFIIFGSLDASVFSAVEEADDNIRFFILLEILHPFAGVSYHIFKFQSAP